jgi:D-alanine transaminase/branched-chain amino acid aminotransferase
MIENGIRLVSYEHQRQLPQVKSTDYMMAIWLQTYINDKQADDLLYHNQGIITECPRSNFFIVTSDDRVITPRDNILKGITRMKVVMLASKSLPMEERNLSIDEILLQRRHSSPVPPNRLFR